MHMSKYSGLDSDEVRNFELQLWTYLGQLDYFEIR